MKMKLKLIFILPFLLLSCAHKSPRKLAQNLTYKIDNNDHYLIGVNFNEIPTHNEDGTINMVVEIPAGSNQKWEVKKDGILHWDKKDGELRFVDYLAYPANYGMIPGTVAGDGDPMDVIVLGPSKPLGSVVRIRPIGVIRAMDGKKRDDKIIAVFHEEELTTDEMRKIGLYRVTNLVGLQKKYKGIVPILVKFFKYYKRDKFGKSKMKILGVSGMDQMPELKKSLFQ